MEDFFHKEQGDIVQILQDKNVNFVGLAMTKWHAYGIRVAIECLKEKGMDVIPAFFIQQHNTGKFFLKKKEFEEYDADVYVLESMHGFREKVEAELARTLFFSGLRKTNKGLAPLYIAAPIFPSSIVRKSVAMQVRREVIFLKIDEGVGAHLNEDSEYARQACIDAVEKKFESMMRIASSSMLARVRINQILALKKKGQYFELNPFVGEGMASCLLQKYRTCIERRAEKNETNSLDYKGKILINTQPLHQYGMVAMDADLQVIKKLAELLNNSGYEVVIKPHPREGAGRIAAYSNMNCEIDLREQAQEELVCMSGYPRAVIGFTSTTLVTLGAIFNIKAISITKMVPSEFLSNKMSSQQDRFIEVFKEFVSCVESEEELLTEIKMKR